MRFSLALLGLPLVTMVGCYGGERRNTGKCPAGETCSDQTPGGLDFVGNHLVGDILLSGPRATAIGGTQEVALEYDRGDGIDVALDLPFTADAGAGAGIAVESTSGSQVTIRGTGNRSNYLRILDEDGLLMDRKELSGAAVESIELVDADFESIPEGVPLAFAPGGRRFGVALYGGGERLVDTSMVVSLTGSHRVAWDTLEVDARVGTYPLAVTAGDKPTATLDFVVVAHADALSAISPMTKVPPSNTGSTTLCFQATTGGRYIAGLSWSYVVDGEPFTAGVLTANCIAVSTPKTSGTVSVQASAGGQSTTLTLNVGAAARSRDSVPMRSAAPAVTTAGDRASL